MSLYNMVHGTNALARVVIALLETNTSNLGRFRDAWVEKVEGGGLRLTVYTRSGGPNREHDEAGGEEGEACRCNGCTVTYALPKHPLYIEDEDDVNDNTYAAFYFRVPEDVVEKLLSYGAPPEFKLEMGAIEKPNSRERLEAALTALGGNNG